MFHPHAFLLIFFQKDSVCKFCQRYTIKKYYCASLKKKKKSFCEVEKSHDFYLFINLMKCSVSIL